MRWYFTHSKLQTGFQLKYREKKQSGTWKRFELQLLEMLGDDICEENTHSVCDCTKEYHSHMKVNDAAELKWMFLFSFLYIYSLVSLLALSNFP